MFPNDSSPNGQRPSSSRLAGAALLCVLGFGFAPASGRILAAETAESAPNPNPNATPEAAASETVEVMPLPAELHLLPGRMTLDRSFAVAVTGPDDRRLRAAIERARRRLATRTGLNLAERPGSGLKIECGAAGPETPALGEDESYTLDISPRQAVLRAPAVVGILRGLETFLQLVRRDRDGWYLPAAAIRDQPRFPWRGLLIDVCRHWQPIEVIERNLDGMALTKLNVLHLHLTEDQGFRVESRTHPELQRLGSNGHYFTQVQIREIIAYARDRGIRVMPEFDLPGHSTSWVVSHPELASAPGPYRIERRWGIFNPVLDPTDEGLYAMLGDFLGEMAQLFPDPFVHVGGDENNGIQWNANPRIQAFIREHGLGNNAGLHAYFNRRVGEILARNGKRLVGWDEILHPDLPHDAVIQSWRGTEALAAAVRQGYSGLLSNGYYINLCRPAAEHYLVDPLAAAQGLTPEERSRVFGGEATMWSERVSSEIIDSRIWPRTAAIAERLWSPAGVRDVDDMYRRLAAVGERLTEAGLRHASYRDAMLRRLAGADSSPQALAALRTFAEAVEPVKDYRQHQTEPESDQWTPLTRMEEAAAPESEAARKFAVDSGRWIFAANPDRARAARLRSQLEAWRDAGALVAGRLASENPGLDEVASLAHALSEVSAIGIEAIDSSEQNRVPDAAWLAGRLLVLDDASNHLCSVEIPFLPALRLLVAAAAEQAARSGLSLEAWRSRVNATAFPPASRPGNPPTT